MDAKNSELSKRASDSGSAPLLRVRPSSENVHRSQVCTRRLTLTPPVVGIDHLKRAPMLRLAQEVSGGLHDCYSTSSFLSSLRGRTSRPRMYVSTKKKGKRKIDTDPSLNNLPRNQYATTEYCPKRNRGADVTNAFFCSCQNAARRFLSDYFM